MNNKEYTTLVNLEQYPEDPIVPVDDIFMDDRGEIINLMLDPNSSVSIINSKKNTVRSNHWHKNNWHYLYVISGSMKYLEKNVDGTNLKEMICIKGQLIFTAPNKIHRTEFLEDTILLSIGKSPKDHENHEEDIVRVEF